MFSHIKELFTRPSGYQISRSVRLRSSASAYFNRTPASAGNQQKWTMSLWVKRGTLSTYQMPFSAWASGSGALALQFQTNDTFSFYQYNAGYQMELVTSQVFRDPSAWYHFVFALDTTQATSTNRVKIYVNGVQITSFSTATYPSQNANLNWNGTIGHAIGQYSGNNTQYFDGYTTEINHVDGQQLTPSSFGQTNSVTGVWQPIKYAGTYGNNGFYLNFSDNSAATAAAIGKDYSGNGNNWTPNNISVTAGVTYDSMIDVPTMWADGGDGRGNYCTISPFQMAVSGPLFSLSSGNLNYSCSASTGNAGRMYARGTMALHTGKTYWEVKVTNTNPEVGICNDVQMGDNGSGSLKSIATYNSGQSASNTSATYTGTTFSFTTNDVIGFAYDGTAMTLACYKNNTLIGTWSGIDSTVTWLPMFAINASSSSTSMEANFGQRPFSYTPPTGFVALNTQNLPAPTISNGANYMAATLYTGNASTLAVTNTVNGISFQPDFIWFKARSIAYNHLLEDAVRGAGYGLNSSLTNAESSSVGTGLTAFNSNGFSLNGDFGGTGSCNANTQTYVAWQWKANGSTVSNTSGTITSSVSAGATQGFSVVTFSNATSGTSFTVGHGLGVAPSMVIVKYRNTTSDWSVYHSSAGNNGALFLNLTNAKATSSAYWNNTTPTSSVFTLGSGFVTGTAYNLVAYCFAEVAGYSKFGSYTGNNTSDGPFIYCGFRPRWIMVKSISTGGTATYGWAIFDTSRENYNINRSMLVANVSDAENTTIDADFDILSNGFKPRYSPNYTNGANTYIFAAFAEVPFKYSLAR